MIHDGAPSLFAWFALDGAYIQGFITDPLSFTAEQFAECDRQIGAWLRSGQLVDKFTVADGFAAIPTALLGLFTGQNTGKMMVRVPLPAGLAVSSQSARL